MLSRPVLGLLQISILLSSPPYATAFVDGISSHKPREARSLDGATAVIQVRQDIFAQPFLPQAGQSKPQSRGTNWAQYLRQNGDCLRDVGVCCKPKVSRSVPSLALHKAISSEGHLSGTHGCVTAGSALEKCLLACHTYKRYYL